MKTSLLLSFAAVFFAAAAASAETRDLGAMTPEAALAYMKQTENLVIVDVATKSWYAKDHFPGAVNIPIEEISAAEAEAMYRALPTGRPVLLHCRLGMIVPGAYDKVKALRPDIPEIGYIAGKPPFAGFREQAGKR